MNFSFPQTLSLHQVSLNVLMLIAISLRVCSNPVFTVVFMELCPFETVPKEMEHKEVLLKLQSFKHCIIVTLYYKVAESNVGWIASGFGLETSWKAN